MRQTRPFSAFSRLRRRLQYMPAFQQMRPWSHPLALPGAGLLLAVLLLPCMGTARAQEDDDQGWAQFSRENTLRATVVTLMPKGKDDGSFAVKTDSGQPWQVLYGVNT